MIYIDTNVLVYASIEQNKQKKEQSIKLLSKSINENNLILSNLVLQEYAFTLSKLKVPSKIIYSDIQFYQQYATAIPTEIFEIACDLCKKIDYFKNINDVIHLKFAERNCTKLITFDSDFSKLRKYTSMVIDIAKK